MTIGRNVLSMDDYLLAIQYFNQAIKGKPYLADPYYYRGIAKLSLDDYQGAIDDETLALQRNKFKSEAYKVRGFALQNLGRDSLAVIDYDKGLEYNPTDKYFLFYKAVAQTSLKRFESADTTFATLLRLNPKFEDGWSARARLNLMRGDTVQALDDVAHALKLSASLLNAYLLRASIAADRRQWKEALADIEEVVRLRPDEPDFYINRAFLRYNTDDFFGAMADYNYALQLNPDDEAALFNRALLRFEVKELEKALDDFTAVIRMDPTNFHAHYNRGLILLDLDRNSEAMKEFKAIAEKYPKFHPVYYALAECSRRLGRFSDVGNYLRHGEGLVAKYIADPEKNPLDRPTIAAGKTHDNATEEDDDEERVMDRFNQLVTRSTTATETAMSFNDRINGRVQDRTMRIEPEPAYSLSFFPPEVSLRNVSNYFREIDDINNLRYIPDKVYLYPGQPPVASEDEIRKIFHREEAYTEALSVENPRPIDSFARGVARLMLKNFEGAAADFTRAAETADNFTAAILGRGYARQMQGAQDPAMLRLAILDLDQALDINPRLVYAWFNKGVIFYNLGDYTSAMQAFSEAISLDPTLGSAYYNRGLAYMQMGNRKAAFADLSKAGELGVLPSYTLLKRMK